MKSVLLLLTLSVFAFSAEAEVMWTLDEVAPAKPELKNSSILEPTVIKKEATPEPESPPKVTTVGNKSKKKSVSRSAHPTKTEGNLPENLLRRNFQKLETT